MEADAPIPNDQVARYLSTRPSFAPLWEPPLAARRQERKEQVIRESGPPEPVPLVEDVDADGVPARLYRASDRTENVLVWLHDGGWVLHDVETFDALTRRLANAAADCAVLSVDYRRGPERPFPAAVDDAWTALEWAGKRFARVAVGGDSAGATLATVSALRARDAGFQLAAQLLVYPVTDYRVDDPTYGEHRRRYEHFAGMQGYGAEYHDSIRWLWEQYVPDPKRRHDPEASPLRASSLAGSAPAVVVTAEHDILRPEGRAYYERLVGEGVDAQWIDYPGQVHGFLEALRFFDDASALIQRLAEALDSRLSAN